MALIFYHRNRRALKHGLLKYFTYHTLLTRPNKPIMQVTCFDNAHSQLPDRTWAHEAKVWCADASTYICHSCISLAFSFFSPDTIRNVLTLVHLLPTEGILLYSYTCLVLFSNVIST